MGHVKSNLHRVRRLLQSERFIPLHFCIGFEDYFGVGPHYRWADDRGEAYNRMLDRTRELPSAPTPEDVIRILAGDERHEWHNQKQVLDLLYDALEDDQEIEGIIGYSEGASIAASFVLHEQWRGKETGRPRRVKCAAFFTGWPPIAPDGQGIVLCDESDLYIDIPTLHIVGANGIVFVALRRS